MTMLTNLTKSTLRPLLTLHSSPSPRAARRLLERITNKSTPW